MKTYTIPELKRIVKEQNYKTACLENAQGEKVWNFNAVKQDIFKHLDGIEKRMKAEITPDGVYFVCLANSVTKQKSPDRYPITKGNVSVEMLKPMSEKNSVQIIHDKSHEVLTWKEALANAQELAELRAENASLKKQVIDLEAELNELPELEEQPGMMESGVSFLKEQAPVITSILDEYFKVKNRSLDIEEKKLGLNGHNKQTNGQQTQKRKFKPLVTGSQEHVNYIMALSKNEANEDKLNVELDKLEAVNEELYKKVCEALGMSTEEEQEEQND